jgi:four helix bundle protein
MASYQSFTEMPLWNEAVIFAADIYRLCEQGRLKTDFRMKEQLRAAAASISNNIAEGFEYSNNRSFIRFLMYAKGSAGEVFNQLTILHKAEMIDQETYTIYSQRSIILGSKIGGFIQYLKSKENPSSAIR